MYAEITVTQTFVPLAMETFGAWSARCQQFVSELGRRITSVTGDTWETSYLRQCLSIAVQRGNAIACKGTMPQKSVNCQFHWFHVVSYMYFSLSAVCISTVNCQWRSMLAAPSAAVSFSYAGWRLFGDRYLWKRRKQSSRRILFGGTKRDHITPLIRDKLHWLRFTQRVTFKLCVLVYKSLHGFAPKYLSNLVIPVSSRASSMRLRSADSLNVARPRTRLKFGDRAFSAAAPDACNSLPLHVKSAPSLDAFTDRLKTELFERSYA